MFLNNGCQGTFSWSGIWIRTEHVQCIFTKSGSAAISQCNYSRTAQIALGRKGEFSAVHTISKNSSHGAEFYYGRQKGIVSVRKDDF